MGIKLSTSHLHEDISIDFFACGAKIVAWYCEEAETSDFNGLSSIPALPVSLSPVSMALSQLHGPRNSG